MNLRLLFQPWLAISDFDCEILGLQNDSRYVRLGDLFIAYPGAVADGRCYIEQAILAGAHAIVYEPANFPQESILPNTVPCIPFPELAQHLAAIASRFFGAPSKKLSVMGVTGTNGKTTIAYQLAQAHRRLGKSAFYMGTLGHGQVPDLQILHNTTPDALEIQRLMAQYVQSGFQTLCMEVSSHALDQHRVDHIHFREAIYTNLSHEHLDYHKTMEAYLAAKARLFAKSDLEWVILNQDDAFVAQIAEAVPKKTRIWTYGMTKTAEVRAMEPQLLSHSSTFTIDSPWGRHAIQIPCLGLFNIYNSLAVFTSLMAHGYPIESVLDIMPHLPSTPGRMEIVGKKPYVIVDFAHTPAALENVLKTIVSLKGEQPIKIWVVFGCGGNRDKTKRPLMAKVVSEQADHVIVTSDNPRHEDPEAIIQDITVGLVAGADATTIVDRREAIHYALSSAGPEDIVLIAGKGHENYQIIGDAHLHFSDQEEVRQFMTHLQ